MGCGPRSNERKRRVQHAVREAKRGRYASSFFAAARRSTQCGYDPALRALTWLRQVSVRRNEWGSAPAYFAVIRATVVSSMRLLKPHSLSYQEETFTKRPDTLVSVASKFDDAGLWL